MTHPFEGLRLALLDYGMGNLRSVEKAIERYGIEVIRTSNPDATEQADGLILPGVGAFPNAMRRIRELGLDELVVRRAAQGTPVLGICLGMQLLLSSSEELGGERGLGLIEGEVRRIDAGELKVPHIGWSPVTWCAKSPITPGLGRGVPFYFVHSFIACPSDPADALGTAVHGEEFVCAIARGNVFGVQFHPEKSSSAGLWLLRNFALHCGGIRSPA